MTASIRLGLVQMCSTSQVSDNLAYVDECLLQASQNEVDVVQLPENFAQMPVSASQQHTEIDSDNGALVHSFLREKSKHYQIDIIAGSLAVRPDQAQKPFSRCLVVSRDGNVEASYDKLHLYDVELPNGEQYKESATYQAGQLGELGAKGAVVSLAGVNFGLSICYDLRFPEYYRTLVEHGAQVLCVPSAFTANTGQAHWQTLLRARAIENQCFVMAAAQGGTHENGRSTWGHSILINPWGDVLCNAEQQSGLIFADIDLGSLQTIRKEFPVLQHRRADI